MFDGMSIEEADALASAYSEFFKSIMGYIHGFKSKLKNTNQ